MTEYEILPKDTTLSAGELVSMYNEAVETIRELQHRYSDLDESYDALFEDYEKIANQLYG